MPPKRKPTSGASGAETRGKRKREEEEQKDTASSSNSSSSSSSSNEDETPKIFSRPYGEIGKVKEFRDPLMKFSIENGGPPTLEQFKQNSQGGWECWRQSKGNHGQGKHGDGLEKIKDDDSSVNLHGYGLISKARKVHAIPRAEEWEALYKRLESRAIEGDCKDKEGQKRPFKWVTKEIIEEEFSKVFDGSKGLFKPEGFEYEGKGLEANPLWYERLPPTKEGASTNQKPKGIGFRNSDHGKRLIHNNHGLYYFDEKPKAASSTPRRRGHPPPGIALVAGIPRSDGTDGGPSNTAMNSDEMKASNATTPRKSPPRSGGLKTSTPTAGGTDGNEEVNRNLPWFLTCRIIDEERQEDQKGGNTQASVPGNSMTTTTTTTAGGVSERTKQRGEKKKEEEEVPDWAKGPVESDEKTKSKKKSGSKLKKEK